MKSEKLTIKVKSEKLQMKELIAMFFFNGKNIKIMRTNFSFITFSFSLDCHVGIYSKNNKEMKNEKLKVKNWGLSVI